MDFNTTSGENGCHTYDSNNMDLYLLCRIYTYQYKSVYNNSEALDESKVDKGISRVVTLVGVVKRIERSWKNA
jgi:hypothetical protein